MNANFDFTATRVFVFGGTSGINLGIANATLEADGREIYTCEDLRVGLFTSLSQF